MLEELCNDGIRIYLRLTEDGGNPPKRFVKIGYL